MNYERFEHTIPSLLDTRHSPLTKNIFLVNMTKEINPYFSELTLMGIEKYLKLGKKIGILVNKKGYSNGIICQTCGHIPQCKKCSVSISYHKIISGETIGLCHLCKTQYTVPTSCSQCGSTKVKEFGIGTQKVAEFLRNEFNVDSLIIESESVNSPNKIAKIIGQIGKKPDKSDKPRPNNLSDVSDHSSDFSVVIGTSLLATPIKNHPFDLIIFLNADLGLNIPDYTSAEKNFYFLYETFAKHQTKHFIVQSFNPDHYSIRNACKLDKDGFYVVDNAFRKENKYPPYAELCVILYKNEIEETMFNKVDLLHKELLYLKEKYELKDIEIYSTPPLIYKMFGKYRYNIILKGPGLKHFMDIIYPKLKLAYKGFKVDRMAESIV
ncbi:MAG: hypothetical protein WC875_02995 [Candidatus Absconditabacterales bacterium]